ncbi:MAG TPA: YciI-like protein [Candidatus Aquilonibacter sp.]|nr:YciI-like protein [Candidatus Aquilonibacter sp.]
MAYFALIYEVVDDYLSRRGAFRDDHLRHARAAHDRHELLLGGAFADPADKALLVFRTDDPSIVESFARNDPYVINGVVKHWEVRPWTVVIGHASDAPPRSHQ